MDASLDSTLELDIGNLSDDEQDFPLGPLDEDSSLPTQRPPQWNIGNYWPSMSKHLKTYCSTCDLCMRKKYPRQNKSGKLSRLASEKPGGLIAIDLLSGLPLSKAGNRYILVITDYATRYDMTIPIPNKEPKTVIQTLFKRWILLIGFPDAIQSDQGSKFTANICKDFYNEMCIHKYTTTA